MTPGSIRILRTPQGVDVFEVEGSRNPANPIRAARIRFNLAHPRKRDKSNSELLAELAYLEAEDAPTEAHRLENQLAMLDIRAELDARRSPAFALQQHRETLALEAANRAPLSYAERILLALCWIRDNPALSPQLSNPHITFVLALAAFARPAITWSDLAALAATIRDYVPPLSADLLDSPLHAVDTLTLAPGAPSRLVCV